MTRQEEIEKIAGAFAIDEVKDTCTCNPASKRGLLYVGFVDGARWADEHPNWISVKDELPPKESEYEDNSIVVLATDGNDVYKGIYQSNEYLSGWFTCDLWALDNVTHWMSLPSVKHLNKE
jgi:hypothetical protein